MTRRDKFRENPLEITWFYLAYVLGTASGIFVIIRGELPLPFWVIMLGLLMYVYLAIDLLWWFGDHPEE